MGCRPGGVPIPGRPGIGEGNPGITPDWLPNGFGGAPNGLAGGGVRLGPPAEGPAGKPGLGEAKPSTKGEMGMPPVGGLNPVEGAGLGISGKAGLPISGKAGLAPAGKGKGEGEGEGPAPGPGPLPAGAPPGAVKGLEKAGGFPVKKGLLLGAPPKPPAGPGWNGMGGICGGAGGAAGAAGAAPGNPAEVGNPVLPAKGLGAPPKPPGADWGWAGGTFSGDRALASPGLGAKGCGPGAGAAGAPKPPGNGWGALGAGRGAAAGADGLAACGACAVEVASPARIGRRVPWKPAYIALNLSMTDLPMPFKVVKTPTPVAATAS
jgi:hypothetical protein